MTEGKGADVSRRAHSLTTLRGHCVAVQEVWIDNRFAVVISRARLIRRPSIEIGQLRAANSCVSSIPVLEYHHQDTWSVVRVAIKAPFENDEL
jgi:hypothetical protein